ncbi:hypothetical protein C7212DRAFT_338523 [Tuber magnatum]|uniref:DUF202 domain-containing protein n=1 Tax=Tuber magnatum TaxID=42249 RepID=A0A317SD44_9PEZI|nr:hypothetical protein C7212DRAFT_338523 [Tuber magnatum]
MFESASTYTLRQHRANSVVLTQAELVEIRAAQRTFEGAYLRTALSQFSFSLIILRIFTQEFYSIGALFAVFGAFIMLASLLRRRSGNRQFFRDESEGGRKKFRTSGNVVAVVSLISIAAYSALLVLLCRLQGA